MKIGIACDHAGFELKELLKQTLIEQGHELVDFGTNAKDSVDYPDFAHPLATAVEKGEVERGIAICYTGNGINMVMNKHQGVRAALCWNTELASLARHHNNANVCSLPAHFVTSEVAKQIINTFLTEPFDGGRHERRVNKIPVV